MKGIDILIGGNGFTPELACRMIAVIGIIVIELYALHQGINGVGIGASVAAIAGIPGVKIGQAMQKRIDKKEEQDRLENRGDNG